MKYTSYFLALAGVLVCGPTLVAQSSSSSSSSSYAPAAPAISMSAPSSGMNLATNESILTIKKRVNEVNVLFIATDKHGKFVRDLGENDFAFLDDNKPPQSISNFRRETDLPLELGLLVDTSGSVRTRFDFEQEAAITFLQRTIRPGFDKAFVAGFATHSDMTPDFTDNVSLLSRDVKGLKNGGGTALYDAIYHACRDKLARDHDQDATGKPVRRAIIVVSDGEDNQSEISRAQAIEMAQRAEVIIYAISTDDSGLILRGDKSLQQLADATGGKAFFPFKMKDVKNSFSAIEEELRSQYVVSYEPADFDADGRYRSIEITALRRTSKCVPEKAITLPSSRNPSF